EFICIVHTGEAESGTVFGEREVGGVHQPTSDLSIEDIPRSSPHLAHPSRMSRIASSVFQLRVVAGTPNVFSTTSLGYRSVRPCRRQRLTANLPETATTLTCQSVPSGRRIGSRGNVRGRFPKTV